jgi:hypothetical protein
MVLTRPTVDRDPDEHACGVDRHVERFIAGEQR